MTKYDWVVSAGAVLLAVTAMWFQVRYYRLVDELIAALSQPTPSKEDN